MKISPARTAAFDVLFRIETEQAFSSILLPIYEEKLQSNDRGLCHEITLGVLRRKLYLDRLIDQLSDDRKLDVEVRLALRIGLYQIIFLDRIPTHAAIDESVELVARARKRSAKGFVNALLRQFQREPVSLEFDDEVERVSVMTSHPKWLVERWSEQFGFDKAASISEANNQTPAAAFRLIGAVESHTEVLAGLDSVRPFEFVTEGFIAETNSEKLIALAQRNVIYFQDEGSQLVADAVVKEKGKRVLDVCAAPGGKTTIIAKSLAAEGFVVAGDIHSERVVRLKETCERHGAEVIVVQYDAEYPLPFAATSFAVVFVDASCSGTGTIRHNPEIRYSMQTNDLEELSGKQLRILENASEQVAENGRLVYSTCSLEFDENEAVCGRFLERHPEFSIAPPKVPERFLTNDGFARTFPDRDKMDGFFIAVFQRRTD